MSTLLAKLKNYPVTYAAFIGGLGTGIIIGSVTVIAFTLGLIEIYKNVN